MVSVLSTFLKWPQFQRGFLAVAEQDHDMQTANMDDLQRLLLAYYRLLQVNRDLPRSLGWPLSPLSHIMRRQHSNLGVRYLAIQCYALQTGMIEGERVKIEKELVGDWMKADCTIQYGSSLDGTIQMLDGWLLHMTEAARLLDARNELLKPQNYYASDENNSFGPLQTRELSPLVANVHGVLMLRSSNHAQLASSLISTPTTTESLRKIALHLSMGVPTLLTSSPSSGKSLLLSHLSTTLFPDARNQIVTIHLADTSLDPRSLLGSYISSPTRPGTFDWKEGVLVRAMREGRWVVLEDIDRASNEVLGMIKPLVETLAEDKWVGGRASMEVPGRGRIEADEHFKIFATRSLSPSRNGGFSPPTFYGAHIFREVVVPSPTHADLRMIVDTRYPRLAGAAAEGLILLWEAIRVLGSTSSTRDVGLRELEKLCTRVDKLLPSSYVPVPVSESVQPQDLSAVFTNPTLREDIFLETRDVFFGAGATNITARSYFVSVASTVAEHLGLSPERRDWATNGFTPEFALEKDVNGSIAAVRLGRTRLVAASGHTEFDVQTPRPFAMHKPAMSLLSRIATAVSLGEPVLLTGETGTGKTSVVTHLASLLRKPLISLNLSNQTESADIVGGFKPVDARVPASQLQQRFLDLFSGTFSRKKNAHFEGSVRNAVQEGKWKRAVGLWLEACRLARDRIRAKISEEAVQAGENGKPRKRRKVDQELNVSDSQWATFEQDVRTFEVQHVQGNGKFAFGFVEGPLVKALRAGHWILLDEVNLASPETLECISSLLHGPTASITLTEQGSLEPIPRHSEFRLFACMNPATDVGKKDLPPNIRSRFTEIDVPPPDADKETLLSIVTQYIGHCAVGDMGVIMDVAEFYTATRTLAERRELADGTNHRPHFSMRTLARALTFASDLASAYSLRRSLWEGCLMAFTMSLDDSGAKIVTSLAQKYILSGVRNPRSLLSKEPAIPTSRRHEEFVKYGPFFLERGPLPEDAMDEYIMTPSVEKKLVDLARILVTGRFPVLIEGPTSAGKTSSIEYLARRTGHRFVRINNHEHTDIQEYLGTYVSDPTTGKLVFRDGLLVRALREGDWIVLDELNLAPTDVLEALNRLLDDNRELVIPETQEVVRPHPHFMLFATQNPPGLYAGRKVLSRAFRNRFLEVHFDDVPQAELETILCQRCRIAPSYGQRIVSVFRELQKRRQSSRIFESKQGFATLRDLFRWAGRDAVNYQELADNGYMLLAERTRKEEDKQVVKEVIETVMKVTIDAKRLYNLQQPEASLALYLGCSPPQSTRLVWTSAMQRLFILIARALRFNEPVLLVGETGCGKTSVCQVYAEILSKTLYAVNCHQNTETADLIGGMRPVRNRGSTQVAILRDASVLLESLGHAVDPSSDAESMIAAIDKLLKTDISSDKANELRRLRGDLRKSLAMFEWHDGPLIHAMRRGDVFLLDEISLADDSVLERLNSVLETSRTIVLAERGGDDSDVLAVQAAEGFKLVATMNPGGDYGKKELSPALRNRFTEIWVPPVDSRHDLELIVGSLWRHNALKSYAAPLLDFTQWLSDAISDSSLVGLRDILAWVEFSNAVYESRHIQIPSPAAIFHHAARMTLLDGLGSLPQMSSYTPGALKNLHENAVAKLQELVPLSSEADNVSVENQPGFVQLGTFSIPKGPAEASSSLFSFEAPTTRDNVMRVVRACQLPKPILLEGSPGVGKTSLISALANTCGYELCRINLSDQTDLVDLFGSDLPVEGGAPGEFAWKDAEFLRALQEGRWVLLDEMNLAPQAILEGLNAVLDHRGTVYIPELGRSFTRHPSFRIFAAQNPLHQGGGRKGLPKSFLNRFTKVYVQELSNSDVLLVCRNLFPTLPEDMLCGMIDYTTRLNEEVMVKRTFGRDGAPWEFNLRDLIRWGSLLQNADLTTAHPSDFLNILFLQRFRVPDDRHIASNIFRSIFENAIHAFTEPPDVVVSPNLVQIGNFIVPRSGSTIGRRAGVLLQAQLSALEAIAACVANGWLTIMTGPRRSGKSSLVRFLAQMTGHTLYEIPINNATDAADILGSFEELDIRGQAMQNLERLDNLLRVLVGSQCGSKLKTVQELMTSIQSLGRNWSDASYDSVRQTASEFQQALVSQALADPLLEDDLNSALDSLLSAQHSAGRFEWVDGPLVKALRNGLWVCLDGANLCNPSVLDRLNSLCEKDGCLILNERGAVDGEVETIKPHPNFRLFMCVDSHYGELSRAMRNRGVEVALVPIATSEDLKRLSSYYRLPIALESTTFDDGIAHLSFECIRRGLSIAHNASTQPAWPSRLLICEDSPSSSLLDLAESLKFSTESGISKTAQTYFAASTIAPYHIPLLSRFVHQHVNPEGGPLSSISALTQSHAFKVAYKFRQTHSSAHPLELLLSQVSKVIALNESTNS
ncbi:hypothetical protein EIP86_006504 [Pleurotus ostreatoroseus]|nr:hypothetical protein EIP86_006504 [Pleurotus ostreatoroseus]